MVESNHHASTVSARADASTLTRNFLSTAASLTTLSLADRILRQALVGWRSYSQAPASSHPKNPSDSASSSLLQRHRTRTSIPSRGIGRRWDEDHRTSRGQLLHRLSAIPDQTFSLVAAGLTFVFFCRHCLQAFRVMRCLRTLLALIGCDASSSSSEGGEILRSTAKCCCCSGSESAVLRFRC